MLAPRYFMVAHLHLHAHALQRPDDLVPHSRCEITGREIKVASHIMRHRRGFPTRLLLEEETPPRADIVLEAHLLGFHHRALQDMAGIAFERLSVWSMDIADHPCSAVVLPGQHRVRAHVRMQHHVALENARESFYGGAVEPDALLQRLLQPLGRDVDGLDHAVDVGELQLDVFDAVLLRLFDKVHGLAPSKFSYFVDGTYLSLFSFFWNNVQSKGKVI